MRDFISKYCAKLQGPFNGTLPPGYALRERGNVCIFYRCETSFYHLQVSFCVVAYLPSTFAMYGMTMAHTLALQPPSASRTIQMFSIVGITSVISWPFIVALAPILVMNSLFHIGWNMVKIREFIYAVIKATIISIIILV
jgi:hypothetical protein